jgi:hypothetical protein
MTGLRRRNEGLKDIPWGWWIPIGPSVALTTIGGGDLKCCDRCIEWNVAAPPFMLLRTRPVVSQPESRL